VDDFGNQIKRQAKISKSRLILIGKKFSLLPPPFSQLPSHLVSNIAVDLISDDKKHPLLLESAS
jgi:hypothetical protein